MIGLASILVTESIFSHVESSQTQQTFSLIIGVAIHASIGEGVLFAGLAVSIGEDMSPLAGLTIGFLGDLTVGAIGVENGGDLDILETLFLVGGEGESDCAGLADGVGNILETGGNGSGHGHAIGLDSGVDVEVLVASETLEGSPVFGEETIGFGLGDTVEEFVVV